MYKYLDVLSICTTHIPSNYAYYIVYTKVMLYCQVQPSSKLSLTSKRWHSLNTSGSWFFSLTPFSRRVDKSSSENDTKNIFPGEARQISVGHHTFLQCPRSETFWNGSGPEFDIRALRIITCFQNVWRALESCKIYHIEKHVLNV